jgi:DNA transposition AAA+ family ATPase
MGNVVEKMTTFADTIAKLDYIPLEEISDATFVKTKAFEKIAEAMEYGRKMRTPFVLVTGVAGVGKTFTLSRYAERNKGVLFWECPPKYEMENILRDLCKKLGVSGGYGWRFQLSTVIDAIKEMGTLSTIILDEAQRINQNKRIDYSGFDVLKYLADQLKITVVFSSTTDINSRLDRWADISSRIGVRVEAPLMDLKEFERLYKKDFSSESLKALHAASQGRMRTIQHMLRHIEEALSIHQQQNPGKTISTLHLTPDDIARITQKVVRYGIPR